MFIIVALVTVYVGSSAGEKQKRRPKMAIASGKEVRLALGGRTRHRKNYAVQLNFKNTS